MSEFNCTLIKSKILTFNIPNLNSKLNPFKVFLLKTFINAV